MIGKPTGINRIVRNRAPRNTPNIKYHENETVRKNTARNKDLVEKVIGRPFDGRLTRQECKKVMEAIKNEKK